MPQMAPLNWCLISPFSVLMVVTTIVMIYFSFNSIPSQKSETSNKNIKMSPSFKW